jgi:hypothetical protein
MQDTFDYSDTYYKSLTTGWNKESYPVISKLTKPVLE